MLKNEAFNNSFDKLVSGISAEERRFLLERLKQEHAGKVPQSLSVPDEQASDTRALHVRIQTESPFYRFILWLRTLLTNQSRETLYNKDVMADAARKIARAHPGLIDFPHGILESIFYEKLKDLLKCQHLVNKLVFEYKLNIEFLRAVIDGENLTLQGVADSAILVERAIRIASEEHPEFKVTSAISVVQDFKAHL